MDDKHGPGLRVEVPDSQKGGVWANFARVTHSPYEFTLDFARIDFSVGEGVVVARVNLSPLLVSQLLDALTTNWESYAAKALPTDLRPET